ncbi:hypothetical protein ACJZ2D_013909 [Fusarium nematophilum]
MGFNTHASGTNDPPEVRNWRIHLIALVASMSALASESFPGHLGLPSHSVYPISPNLHLLPFSYVLKNVATRSIAPSHSIERACSIEGDSFLARPRLKRCPQGTLIRLGKNGGVAPRSLDPLCYALKTLPASPSFLPNRLSVPAA